MVPAWVERLVVDDGLPIEYVAMDNEPELWGHTHYDVHPSCTTYEEVLDKYLAYADAVREVAPDVAAPRSGGVLLVRLLGYRARGGRRRGRRLPHVVPRPGAPARRAGRCPLTPPPRRPLLPAERRVQRRRPMPRRPPGGCAAPARCGTRATSTSPGSAPRSGSSPGCTRRSPPAYPGTGLAISEWNFGADSHDERCARHRRRPRASTGERASTSPPTGAIRQPRVLATSRSRCTATTTGGLELHRNGRGDHDVLTSIASAAYAAIDDASGLVRVMLINKTPDRDVTVPVRIDGAARRSQRPDLYRYTETAPAEIVHDRADRREQLRWSSTCLRPRSRSSSWHWRPDSGRSHRVRSRTFGRHPAQELGQPLDVLGRVEVAAHDGLGGRAQPEAEPGIVDECAQRPDERGAVVRGDDQAGLAVAGRSRGCPPPRSTPSAGRRRPPPTAPSAGSHLASAGRRRPIGGTGTRVRRCSARGCRAPSRPGPAPRRPW